MQAVTDFFVWLFTDRMGVVALIVGGILVLGAGVLLITKKRMTKEG